MSTLSRKLLRTINSTRGQFVALVVIVTLGVLIYIGMNTAYYNLERSQQQFYSDYRFADYFFQVVKAPESVIARIELIPGVVKATGRIQQDVALLKENNERATARLTGYPLPMEKEVNQLHLLSGRMFGQESSHSVEVLVDPQYAAANQLANGQVIQIIADGKKADLIVNGIATSPEFVYPMRDASSMFPEPQRFAIIMLSQRNIQQILGMPGQINQVVIDLAPGADETLIKTQIEEILKPYGNLASYARKDQISHAYLDVELEGLRINSRFLPLLFFLIAAGIQFVILTRMIRSQRMSIGVLKAIGYSNLQIVWHYTSYAILVSLVGAVFGTLAGMGMAKVMSDVYALFFNLPQTIGGLNVQVVIQGFLISSMVGAASGLFASRSVLRITPAEAMRPEPPVSGRRIVLENLPFIWKRLGSSWRMSLRSILRNRARFAVTVLGVMSSVVLLVFASFTNDAIDYLLSQSFKQVNHYDYIVRFTAPIKYSEIMDWNRWDSVQKQEPMLEIPVKIHAHGRTEDELLTGINPAGSLKQVYDINSRQLQIPEEGILLSSPVANKLGLKTGDIVKVETAMGLGASRTEDLKIAAIYDPMMGASYISYDTANQLLGESQVITAVMLKMDAPEVPAVEARLQEMPKVSSVMSPAREQESFLQLLDTMLYFILVMIMFAGLLGLAIVYNTATMTFQERRRELASLRVMGYSHAEVARLLSQETWIQAVIGIALGLPAGKLMGAVYMSSVSTDLFSFPAIIYPRTYFIAALAAIIFVWIGQQLAVRRVKNIDMVEALKNRD